MRYKNMSVRLFFIFLLLSISLSFCYGINSIDDIHGFLDMRGGLRTGDDTFEDDLSLGETRFQLAIENTFGDFDLNLRTDFLYDYAFDEYKVDLENGRGFIDLREANIVFSPLDIIDLKIGRQILTWGTGDMLFINDLFPKDWQSFFIGRDEDYLKAPSDAVFISIFPSFADIDIVYTPRFDSDRYINGSRVSYWNPNLESVAGQNATILPEEADRWFNDDEVALRISRDIASYELSLYFYDGLWKNPVGVNSESGAVYFPRLSVYGMSVRGVMGKGIISMEAGYYNSLEDKKGDNPLIPNGEERILVGYERELIKNLSLNLQYYIEHMLDYSQYKESLLGGLFGRDRNRHVATLRLTGLALNQNLILSFFVYYSASDDDAYLRPILKYKLTDNLLVTAGANLFIGKYEHTFFGQFEDNSNIYIGGRYIF